MNSTHQPQVPCIPPSRRTANRGQSMHASLTMGYHAARGDDREGIHSNQHCNNERATKHCTGTTPHILHVVNGHGGIRSCEVEPLSDPCASSMPHACLLAQALEQPWLRYGFGLLMLWCTKLSSTRWEEHCPRGVGGHLNPSLQPSPSPLAMPGPLRSHRRRARRVGEPGIMIAMTC